MDNLYCKKSKDKQPALSTGIWDPLERKGSSIGWWHKTQHTDCMGASQNSALPFGLNTCPCSKTCHHFESPRAQVGHCVGGGNVGKATLLQLLAELPVLQLQASLSRLNKPVQPKTAHLFKLPKQANLHHLLLPRAIT